MGRSEIVVEGELGCITIYGRSSLAYVRARGGFNEIIGKNMEKLQGGNRMKMVIVESKAKSKTIQKYLGKLFIVRACMGHVQDLPTKGKDGSKALWSHTETELPDPPWDWTARAERNIGRIISGMLTPLLLETIPSFKISVVNLSTFCSITCNFIFPSSISIIVLGVRFS